MLAVLGILVSAQQVAVLALLGEPKVSKGQEHIRRYRPLLLTEVGKQGFEVRLYSDGRNLDIWRPRWKMVFTWQCPIMFVSYSVVYFPSGIDLVRLYTSYTKSSLE